MLNARQAYQNYNSNIPELKAVVEKALKEGKVRKEYVGALKVQKGKYYDFLVKYALLSSERIPGTRIVGDGAGPAEIMRICPKEWEQWKGLTKTINDLLGKAKSSKTLQPYIRSVKETPVAPATAAAPVK